MTRGSSVQAPLFPGLASIPPTLEGKLTEESLGLTYDRLRVFLGGSPQARQSNYREAEFLYYGVQDIERFRDGTRDGLPQEAYESMTIAERAGLFIGNGRLK